MAHSALHVANVELFRATYLGSCEPPPHAMHAQFTDRGLCGTGMSQSLSPHSSQRLQPEVQESLAARLFPTEPVSSMPAAPRPPVSAAAGAGLPSAALLPGSHASAGTSSRPVTCAPNALSAHGSRSSAKLLHVAFAASVTELIMFYQLYAALRQGYLQIVCMSGGQVQACSHVAVLLQASLHRPCAQQTAA